MRLAGQQASGVMSSWSLHINLCQIYADVPKAASDSELFCGLV